MWAALFHLILLDMMDLSHESFLSLCCFFDIFCYGNKKSNTTWHGATNTGSPWVGCNFFKPTSQSISSSSQYSFLILPLKGIDPYWTSCTSNYILVPISREHNLIKLVLGMLSKNEQQDEDLEHCLIMKIPLHISRWSNKQTLPNWRHLLKCSLVVNWEDM